MISTECVRATTRGYLLVRVYVNEMTEQVVSCHTQETEDGAVHVGLVHSCTHWTRTDTRLFTTVSHEGMKLLLPKKRNRNIGYFIFSLCRPPSMNLLYGILNVIRYTQGSSSDVTMVELLFGGMFPIPTRLGPA